MDRVRRILGVVGVMLAGAVVAALFLLPMQHGFPQSVCLVIRVTGVAGVCSLALFLGCRHARRDQLMLMARESVAMLLEEALHEDEDPSDLYGGYLLRMTRISGSRWGGLLILVPEGTKRFLWMQRAGTGPIKEMDGTVLADRLYAAGIWQQVVQERKSVAYPADRQALLDLDGVVPGGVDRRFLAIPIVWRDLLVGVMILSGFSHGFNVVRHQVCTLLGAALAQGLSHRKVMALRYSYDEEREQWSEEMSRRVSELEESERRFRRLVESSADAIMIVGLDGHVMYVNPAATTFYGRSEADLLGRPVEAIGEPGGHGQIRVFPAGEPARWGEVRTVDTEWRGEPAFLVSVRDITQRKRAEEALTKHKDQLEELIDARTNELRQAVGRLEMHNRAKSEFVSNVSHELRTPLASMRSGLKNLLRGICGPLSEQVVSYLSMLYEESERLIATVEDILDISRIEMGRLALYSMPIPIVRICDHAVEMLRVAARTKSIELRCGYVGCRLFVDGDTAKLERVCVNIVENAIKYTPDGGRVVVALEEGEGSVVRLKVSDTGVGISEVDLPHVFERYYRVGSHVDGMGVGLALSAEIVRAHGGRITVASPPDGEPCGTEVCLSLPVVQAPCIGFIDGSEGEGSLVAETLGVLGYRMVRLDPDLATGPALLECGVSALILDMSGSGMDGLEVLARLRQQDVNRDLPVLVLVGAGREETKRRVVRNLQAIPLMAPYAEGHVMRGLSECLVQRRDVPFVRPEELEGGSLPQQPPEGMVP